MRPHEIRTKGFRESRTSLLLLALVFLTSLFTVGIGWFLSASPVQPPALTATSSVESTPTSVKDKTLSVFPPIARRESITIAGRVEQVDGTPVSTAGIALLKRDDATDTFGTALHGLLSDDGGRFRFEAPQSGAYRLQTLMSGFLPGALDVQVPEEGLTDVRLVLDPLCSVTGKVQDALGKPVAGIHVSPVPLPGMVTEDRLDEPVALGPTDKNGVFCVQRLYPGRYRFMVSVPPPSGETSSGPFRVLGLDEKSSGVETALARGEQKKGVVIRLGKTDIAYVIDGYTHGPDGKPIAGATVWAAYAAVSNGAVGRAAAPSQEDGYFAINTVNDNHSGEDGKFVKYPVIVVAEAKDYEQACVGGVPWGTSNLDITLMPRQRGALSGVVLDKVSREPVANARVSAWQVYTAWGGRWRPDYNSVHDRNDYGVQTDTEGRFELSDVLVGEGTLQVAHPAYGVSLHRGGIEIAQDETTPVQILLDPAGTVEVEVIPADSLPVADLLMPYLEVFPLDILEDKDAFQSPDNGPNPDFEAPAEIGAGMRFGNAVGHSEKGYVLSKRSGNHWKGSFKIAPGNYVITIRAQRDIRFAQKYPVFMLSHGLKVRSGEVEQVTFDVGGGGTIEGTVSSVPTGEICHLLLAEGVVSSGMHNPDRGVLLSYLQTQLSLEGRSTACTVLVAGQYHFDSVPAGDYTLLALVSSPDAPSKQRILCQTSVSVNGADAHTVNLP